MTKTCALQIFIFSVACSTLGINAYCYNTRHIIVKEKQSEKDSLESCLKTAHDTVRIILLNKLSFQYLKTSDYDKALKKAREANLLSQELDYKKGEAKSYVNIGNVYMAQSLLDTAKYCYLKALTLAKSIHNLSIESHCTNNLGELYRHQSNYQKALYYYFQSIKVCELLHDKDGQAETLNNIGLIYRQLNKLSQALGCYQRSLKISRALNDQYNVSATMVNMAFVYAALDKSEISLTFFKEALVIKREINDGVGINSCLVGIGSYYAKKEDFVKAINNYEQGYAISSTIDDKPGMAACLNDMGEIYYKIKHYNKAIAYHLQFLTVCHQTGEKDELRSAYLNLAADYAASGDFRKAYQYHINYTALNDSLFNVQSQHKVTEIEHQYKSEAREQQIDTLKKQHALQLSINQNQKLVFVALACIISMAGIALYYRAQASRTKNMRLTEKVDAQNRELATVALLVTKKNQTFTGIKDQLLESLKRNPEDVPQAVKAILKSIDQEINFDVEWDTFKYHFEKVHPDFFKKLLTAAPSLSVIELRLCAYLRTNLSTKEIASLTNTTIRSVQQAKYRVNQKVSHTAKDLVDYLKHL